MPCSTTQGAFLPNNALLPKDTHTQWPENYFNLFGSWEGQSLQRPEQNHDEQRPSDGQA
jgi:hypothetical protein